MFYTSFDEETYNEWQDDDKCTEAYMTKRNDIEAVKKVVMEWLDPVEEARYYIEEALKNDVNIEEVAIILDAEKKQADIYCEDEGLEADPQYEHLDRGDHNELEFLPSTNWCKKIDLKDDEQLHKEAQGLDRNQRKTFDICLKYA